MSIQNRMLRENGTYPIIFESKFQTYLGKVYCLFRGHKPVNIKLEDGTLTYCFCCWRDLND